MNYIQEINAFYARVETNPLSGSAVCLWHTLMHVNNRAHWVEEFTVAASVLCSKSGLASSTFKRARTELKEKGYIKVTSRGTRAPIYQMVSMCDGAMEQDVGRSNQELSQDVGEDSGVSQEVDQAGTQDEDQVVDQAANQVPGPLIKQNNNKQKNTITSTPSTPGYILDFYNDNFGEATTYIKSEVGFWSERLGDELVYEALKRTVENGKSTWRYTLGILHKWKKNGLNTVSDVIAVEEAFRQERMPPRPRAEQRHSGYEDASRALYYGGVSGRYTPRGQRTTEVIPDWFRELKAENGIIV